MSASQAEVSGPVTMNIAATVWNLLVWAFFIVAVIGVGIGTYAAVSLKKAEGETEREP